MITTTVLGIAIGCLILMLVRRDRMHGAHAVWWVGVAIMITVLGLFPAIVDFVGRELGITYPPILILVIGVCLLFVKALTMDIERSRQEVRIRQLAQRLAVWEHSREAKRDKANERFPE